MWEELFPMQDCPFLYVDRTARFVLISLPMADLFFSRVLQETPTNFILMRPPRQGFSSQEGPVPSERGGESCNRASWCAPLFSRSDTTPMRRHLLFPLREMRIFPDFFPSSLPQPGCRWFFGILPSPPFTGNEPLLLPCSPPLSFFQQRETALFPSTHIDHTPSIGVVPSFLFQTGTTTPLFRESSVPLLAHESSLPLFVGIALETPPGTEQP